MILAWFKRFLKYKWRILATVALICFITIGIFGQKISRLMLSHDLGIMYHALNRVILKDVPKDNKDQCYAAINHFIANNIHPYGKIRDDGPSWIVIYGEAWCDTVAHTFIRLIEPLDTRGYLVFLTHSDGKSHHSLAYMTPNMIENQNDKIDHLQETAYVVDPAHQIIAKDANGDYVTPAEIRKNQAVLPEYPYWWDSFNKNRNKRYNLDRLSFSTWFLDGFSKRPTAFLPNEPLSQQNTIKQSFYKHIFPHVPEAVIIKYIQTAIYINNDFESSERDYYLARVRQIFSHHEQAIAQYQDIIEDYPDTRWAKLATHWKDILEKSENGVINSIYTSRSKHF